MSNSAIITSVFILTLLLAASCTPNIVGCRYFQKGQRDYGLGGAMFYPVNRDTFMMVHYYDVGGVFDTNYCEMNWADNRHGYLDCSLLKVDLSYYRGLLNATLIDTLLLDGLGFESVEDMRLVRERKPIFNRYIVLDSTVRPLTIYIIKPLFCDDQIQHEPDSILTIATGHWESYIYHILVRQNGNMFIYTNRPNNRKLRANDLYTRRRPKV